jgi:uncharacterized protein DUF3800
MLLAYIDESYARGHAYWIGVSMVREERVDDLCRVMRAIPEGIPADFGIPDDVELHGYDVFHGEGFFKPMHAKPQARARIYRQGLEALAGARPEILFVGLDWAVSSTAASLEQRRIEAFRLVLAEIEERCETLRERCLLIADEEETTAHDVIVALREYQNAIHGQGCECRIIDTVMFVDSYNCPGVQATDLAMFLHHRREGGREHDHRAVKLLDKWWATIKPHVRVAKRHPEPVKWPDRAARRPKRTKSHR